MGAACSTKGATRVQDSVKPAGKNTKENLTVLSIEAQEQLKQLQSQNPDAMSTVDQYKLKQLLEAQAQEKKDVGDDVKNQDQLGDQSNESKHQELWGAVEMNDTEKVASYLENYEENSGVELKEQELYDVYGQSVIHKAASLGHAEILILLLERTGAKPDLLNSSLATPLHLACKNNRVDAAKFLIGCGVDANIQDEHGQVPLLICCIHGNLELAKMLIEASTSGHLPDTLEVDVKDHRGLSPLNCAAIKGDLDLTQLLITHGGANVDGTSPKGCTPLLYAARGGYAEVVRFLLLKGASALRQDNAGGTVLHHAIEKSHIEVLNVLQEHGVDVHSAIEIPDNAGRTPIFEAVDNHQDASILNLLIKSRKEGGFEAKVNIMNYNGQTPLFSAAREGNIEVVKALIENCDMKLDLTQGELFKEDYDDSDTQYQSLEEKFFMDAYKNCMTPLQVATVLGYDDIMLYLIEKGSNPNLQTKIKGYSALHLAVLANKPEIIIELLTKTQANPYLPDFGGRTLQDMIEIFIPSYLESFKTLLDNLQYLKQKGLEETTNNDDESLAGLAKRGDGQDEQPTVATHYYNPDDERSLQGVGADTSKIDDLYKKQAEGENEENKEQAEGEGNDKKSFHKKFVEMSEDDIKVEQDAKVDSTIENIMGKKLALALIAADWKYKEIALKIIYKQAEQQLDMQMKPEQQSMKTEELIRGCVAAIGLTCREKVIKVFSISLQLLNLLVSSTKIEKGGFSDSLKNSIVEKNIVLKLLQKSEEGNTRVSNKIHESLLDLSFNPEIGAALTSSFILQRIQAHNRANQLKQQQKNQGSGDKKSDQVVQIETEAALGSYKGLLAQLALLYKFVNSFGIASKSRGPLSVKDILKSVVPTVSHPNQDVRNASGKILLDVQKLSGCVTEEELSSLSDKAKTTLMEKIKKVEVEKNLNIQRNTTQKLTSNSGLPVETIVEEEGDETDCAEVPNTISMNSPSKIDAKKKQMEELKQTISEKGVSKEWQEREQAVKALEQLLQDKNIVDRFHFKDIFDENFLQGCLILLQTCLEENNMTVYLSAVEAASLFFDKALGQDAVYGSLQTLIQPIILRTTDTNTRIRKKSVDLINQVWDYKYNPPNNDKLKMNQLRDSTDTADMQSKTDSIVQIIAQVICEPALGEKAIIGRLGLFIKRAMLIDGSKDLVSQPLQMVLGKNYEQLTEFSCQWVSHKNTKVRQNALKLIIEICRINCMDPRGAPFKTRVLNYILGLRPSQRDPLVLKINEACLKAFVDKTSPGRASTIEPYINVEELDLNIATKTRAASMDHVGAKRRLMSATRRPGSRGGAPGGAESSGSALPSIGNVQQKPSGGMGLAQPTIVLPHSEPLTDEQKNQYQNLIDYFGQQIITCFVSKSWATRQAAIEKVQEQLHNIDPNRRDAMSAEINRQNMPAEISMKIFLEFMVEGLKDPVLKNYIAILELLQQALPTFFRYIQPHQIKSELLHIIQLILRKTTDMKQKIRESSINFCLYLSHQSPVGPEYMVNQVLTELDSVQNESNQTQQKKESVAANFGNSHLISGCLGLLSQYQNQSQILANGKENGDLLKQYMNQINYALRHSNPQVRKEAESLFKVLYGEFGSQLDQMLVNQKPQLQEKLLKQAKKEYDEAKGNKPGQATSETEKEKQETYEDQNIQRAGSQIRNQVMDESGLKKLLKGSEEHLQALKMPNPKVRQKAIIEIKKAISKQIMTQMSSDKAREIFEPITLLMRQLLQDQNSEIYLESLNLLKFIVGTLAPNLSSLDLHLMMGSFVGIIVQNTVSGNMRIQVASDKVIIFFAKHQNIGPFVIAKEVNKNIERINKAVKNASVATRANVLQEKQPILLRFYNIKQMLLTQFSIVLCYQQDFYNKCLECLADTMIISNGQGPDREGGDVAIRTICSQIVNNLYAIDYKLLESSVGKLNDLNRKTPLRKAMIEYEQAQKKGKGYLDITKEQELGGGSINPVQSQDPMRDTQMSFASSTNRQSLFSPGSTRGRERGTESRGAFGESEYQWNMSTSHLNIDNNHGTIDAACDPSNMRQRRMMSLGEKRTPGTNQGKNSQQYLSDHPVSNHTQSQWRRPRETLPSLEVGGQNLNKTGVLLPDINASPGMGGGLGGPAYKFEVPSQRKMDESTNQQASQKFKYKATGGAGFSSTGNKSNGGVDSMAVKGRSPRRALGVLQNNTNVFSGSGFDEKMSMVLNSNNDISPAGIPRPSPQLGGSKPPLKPGLPLGNSKPIPDDKPPLYVPGKRDGSQRSRGGRRNPSNGPVMATVDSSGYQSKTGFSSMSGPPKDDSQSFGQTFGSSKDGSGGYVPTAVARASSKSKEVRY